MLLLWHSLVVIHTHTWPMHVRLYVYANRILSYLSWTHISHLDSVRKSKRYTNFWQLYHKTNTISQQKKKTKSSLELTLFICNFTINENFLSIFYFFNFIEFYLIFRVDNFSQYTSICSNKICAQYKMNETTFLFHIWIVLLCYVYGCKYPGNFMRIKSHVVKNDTRIKMKPIAVSRIRLSFGLPGACVWSIIMKPNPPTVNRKLLARPSIMYWPLMRYGMNATGRECPCSSVVDPTLGGSTITS